MSSSPPYQAVETSRLSLELRYTRACSRAEITSVSISPGSSISPTATALAVYASTAQASQSWVDSFGLTSRTSLAKTAGSQAIFTPAASTTDTGSTLRMAVLRDWCVHLGGGVEIRHNSTILIRDASTGKTVTELKDARSCPVAWSPDGRWIAAGESGGDYGSERLGVWDAKTGRRVGRVVGHIDTVTHAAFTPSRTIVSLSRDGTLRVTDPTTSRTLSRLELAEQRGLPRCLALSPDGRSVVAVWGSAVHIWLPETGHLTSYSLAGVRRKEGWPLCVSPDARYLACRTEDGFDIMEVSSGAVVCDIQRDGLITAAAFSDDGKILLLGKMDGTAEVWDINDKST